MRRTILWIALAFAASAARAQSADFFGVSLIGGKSITTWHGQADVQAISIEAGRALTPQTELQFMLTPVNVRQPRSWFGNQYHDGSEQVRAMSAGMLVRHRFFAEAQRLQPYIEGGTGPFWAEKRVPASTSRFNFMTQAGAGVLLNPGSRAPIVLGYRFLHISNGGYSPRNPGLNVSSLLLGLQFRSARWHRR